MTTIQGLVRKINHRLRRVKIGGVSYVIEKKSEAWPFEPLLEMFADGALILPTVADNAVSVIKEEMAERLGGVQRRTRFRHQEVEMDAAECFVGVSSPDEAGRLLYHVVKCYEPEWVVEMGSAFGVASMYIASALKENGSGSLNGIEYEGWRADLANENVSKLVPGIAAIHTGRIEDILPSLIEKNPEKKIECAFVDAVHKYEDTFGYHRLLEPNVAEGAVVVYDDINWSEEMGEFWVDLLSQPSISDALLLNNRWGIVCYTNAHRHRLKN